ncbi:M56 family metallopeptidase [Mesoterricola silvestris]|uniref:Uncharacterized protein n=1 Tax=Mesoterricola silvestris TaxID=2927979 RepID=A0AA48GZS2_9BACT|nr:M56 family metallopeptidase [Mesoterricola silvestris]BDU74851.1 hypothetical protein METEAL_40250 [Mesoterricola silvestris]
MNGAVPALGWALVHSLWQLAVVGAVAALLLRAVGPGRPRAQYGIALGALVLCLVLPAAGFARGLAENSAALAGGAGAGAGLEAVPVPAPVTQAGGSLAWMAGHVGWIAVAWALGATAMGIRLGGGWLTTVAWRRRATGAPEAWEGRFAALARDLGVRGRVLLRASSRVATPVAVGLWRPVVLVPAALFTALPEAYLEALLAHELAHVARLDYLVNLFQGVIEVLCFHHPVVWWLSRRIRTAREHLCDDLAAKAIGDPRRLALALDALDDVQPHLTSLALAARGGILHERIRRLLTPPVVSRPGSLGPALVLLAPFAALALRAGTPAMPPIQADARVIAELDALAAREGLDPQLLRSMAWAESGLNPKARSPLGAQGILQVLPATATRFGARNLEDPGEVASAGARYLKFLLDRYKGDKAKAVAAYNCGEEALEAGRPGAEAEGYRALVLGLLEARAVQPAAPLGQGWVDGTLRRSGSTWTVWTRVSHRGPLKLEVLPEDPGGKPYGSVAAGGGEPGTPWTESHPRVTLDFRGGATVRVRCTDLLEGTSGEARVPLDGTWKTFAFQMGRP